MGFETEIGWCDCTHNEWIGCAKISRGCRFCYAESLENRWHPATDGRRGANVWGRKAPRRLTSDSNRRKPFTWNRKAQKSGLPLRVFASSLADVFEDHPMLPPWRTGLFHTIEETPWLRWMLLTKRIDLVAAMTAEAWGTDWPTNVWLGTSVERQREADERLPHLLNIEGPAERFISAEPLVNAVVIGEHLNTARYPLSLLIVGGESGQKASPMHPDWARSLRDESAKFDVPFHFKQWGKWGTRQPDEWRPKDWYHNPGRNIVVSLDGSIKPIGDFTGAEPATDLFMYGVGKGAAGRELDGRTHDGVVRSWAAEVGLELAVT